MPLLSFLKHLESTIGRVVSYRNGPRAIDLDILTYDDLIIDTRGTEDRKTLDNLEGQLVVPHPRLYEREFVLRPLNEYVVSTCAFVLSDGGDITSKYYPRLYSPQA